MPGETIVLQDSGKVCRNLRFKKVALDYLDFSMIHFRVLEILR